MSHCPQGNNASALYAYLRQILSFVYHVIFLKIKKGRSLIAKTPAHAMLLLHGLLLRDSFQCFHLLTDTLVQIRYAHPDLLLDSADHFFLRIRKLKEVLIHGIGTAEVDLNRLLWAEKLLLLDESGTCGNVLDAIQDVLCLGRVRVLSPIKIYGSKEEIRARKSPETVDAPGFAPDASIPVTLYGTPDWIRTSGLLQSRGYQAIKPKSPAAQGFGWCCANFRHCEEKPRKPYRARLPRFFALVVK